MECNTDNFSEYQNEMKNEVNYTLVQTDSTGSEKFHQETNSSANLGHNNIGIGVGVRFFKKALELIGVDTAQGYRGKNYFKT